MEQYFTSERVTKVLKNFPKARREYFNNIYSKGAAFLLAILLLSSFKATETQNFFHQILGKMKAETGKILLKNEAINVTQAKEMGVSFGTFTVTNLNDTGTGSLRQAMLDAIAAGNGPHTITFDAGLNGVIDLASNLPTITVQGITVDGDNRITISGNGNDIGRRIFYGTANSSGTVVKNLDIKNTGLEPFRFDGSPGNIVIENINIFHEVNNWIDRAVYINGNIDGLTIKNVDIKNRQNIGDGAIYITGTADNVLIDNFDLSESGGGGLRGIQINGVANNVEIKNCDLDFDLANSTDDGDYGIWFNNISTDVTIDNCTFKYNEIHAIYTANTANNWVISNCTFDNEDGHTANAMIRFNHFVNTLDILNCDIDCDYAASTDDKQYGIWFNQTTNDVTIKGVTIRDADEDAIGINLATTNMIIDSCFFYATTSAVSGNNDGIEFYNNAARTNIEISRCVFDSLGRAGLIFQTTNATSEFNIHDNTFSNTQKTSGYGMWLAGSGGVKDITITQNEIFHNFGPGIYIERADNVLISENSIYQNGNIGINLLGNDANCDYEQLDGDTPLLTNSVATSATTYDLTISLPAFCAGGVCNVEVFINDECDKPFQGRQYVQTFAGLTSGAQTVTVTCATGECLDSKKGFWTATLTAPGCTATTNTSEFSASRNLIQKGPGGVTDVQIWFKADAGVHTNSSDVMIGALGSPWQDQSSNGYHPDLISGTPELIPAGINFNPALYTNGDFLRIDNVTNRFFYNGNTEGEVLTVATEDNAAGSYGTPFYFGGRTDDHYTHSNNAIYTGFGTATRHVYDVDGQSVIAGGGTAAGSTVVNTERPNIFGIYSATNDYAITLNNAKRYTSNVNTVNFSTGATTHLFARPGLSFHGHTGEIMMFDRKLTDTERQRVSSYMAIKYAITLDQETPTDYLASDGTVIWTGASNADYATDITGIGYDSASDLMQKQSKVEYKEVVLAGYNGDQSGGLPTSNKLNPNEFTVDKSFMIWGHNGLDPRPNVAYTPNSFSPSNPYFLIERVWKVQETGTVGTVTLQGPSNASHLIIHNSADFSSGTPTEVALSTTPEGVKVAVVDLNDGEYFTFGREKAPYAPCAGGLAFVHGSDDNGTSGLGVSAWLSNGDGTFSTSEIQFSGFDRDASGTEVFGYDAGSQSFFEDIDNDGDLDIIHATENNSNSIYAYLNNGDNTFQTIPETTTGMETVTNGVFSGFTGGETSWLGDTDNDGNLDYIYSGNDNKIHVFLGNGDGTFATAKITSDLTAVSGYNTSGISTNEVFFQEDLNNDGSVDLVATVLRGSTTEINIFYGQGDGTYEMTPSYVELLDDIGSSNGNGLGEEVYSQFADYDGDGDLDYMHAEGHDATMQIWTFTNLGNGTFNKTGLCTVITNGPSLGITRFANFSAAEQSFFVDVTEDGIIDYITTADNATIDGITVYIGKGDGTFDETPVKTAIPNFATGMNNVQLTAIGCGFSPTREICGNGIDDDGDGLIDDNDDDCVTSRCNGGNFADWTSFTANSACGTVVDLDGNVININLQGGSVLNILDGGAYVNTAGTHSPGTTKKILQIDNAAEPQVASTGPFFYNYDFSKPVTDPIMSLFSLGQAAKTIKYTLTDENGDPIGIKIMSSNDETKFYTDAANELVGVEGHGVIKLEGTFNKVNVQVDYITGTTNESWTGITFGFACPEPVFDICPSPSIVDWVSNTAGQAIGSVTNSDGDDIDVTLTGSIVNIGGAGAFNNANLYDINSPTGERVAIDNAAEPQVTGGGEFEYVWDFSQLIRQPIFNINSMGAGGHRLQYRFTNEDDEPLAFIVRFTGNYENFRQTHDNILEGEEGHGTIQFDGSPTKIKMYVTHLEGSTAENATLMQLIASCPAPEPEDGGGKCNGANFARWNTKSNNTVVGTITDPDGGSSSIVGSGSIINIGYSGYFNNAQRYDLPSRYADRVAIDNAAEPAVNGNGPFQYSWTISNPIENLEMYWFSIGRWGQQIKYTFTDSTGAPIPISVLATNNPTYFYVQNGNELVGREGHGTIRFDVPVTKINMQVDHLTGGGRSEYWTGLTFAKRCAESEAIQECVDPKFADWTGHTASTAQATIAKNGGGTIDVDLTGSVINTGAPGQHRNVDIWDPVNITSERVAIDNAAEPAASGSTGPFNYVWDFSEPLVDPIFNFRSIGNGGVELKYTFTDENNDPLTFCVRKTNNWETFHQTSPNTLHGREGNGSIQVLGSPTQINMQVDFISGSTSEYYTGVQLIGGCKASAICTTTATTTCPSGDPLDLTAFVPSYPAGGTWADEDGSGVNMSDSTTVDMSGLAGGTYNFKYTWAEGDSCHRVIVTMTDPVPAPTVNDILVCEGGSTEIAVPIPSDRTTVLYDQPFNGYNGGYFLQSKCNGPNPSSCYRSDLNYLDNRGLTLEADSTDFTNWNYWWHSWLYDAHNLRFGRMKDEMISLVTTSYSLLPGETAVFSGQSARWWGWMNDEDYVKFAYIIDGVETEFAHRKGLLSGHLASSQGSYTNNAASAQTISMRIKVKNSWNEAHYIDNLKIIKFLAPPTYTYYDDAGLTTTLGTGLIYDPATTPGTTDSIYVTCTQNGCESAATLVEVEVSPNNVQPMGGEPVFYCAGGTNIDFTENISNFQSGGTWADDDNTGITLGDGTNVDVSGLANGSYNFTYTLNGSAPCAGESSLITVNIGESPGTPEIADINVCEGGSTEIIVPNDPDREEVLYQQTFESRNQVYFRSKCTGADASTCHEDRFALLASDRGLNLDAGTDFSAMKWWWHSWIWDYGNLKFARLQDEQISLTTDVVSLLSGETATFSGQSARWWGWMNNDDYVKFAYVVDGVETEFANRTGLISSHLATSQATYKNTGATPVNIQLRVKVKNSWNEAHYIDNLKITKTLNKPTYNFYSDGALTTMVGTGQAYDPGTTAGNTDVVYVTCINNGCETLADTVNVTVAPNSVNPMAGTTAYFCTGGSNINLNSYITDYQSGGTWMDDEATGVTLGDGSSVNFASLADGIYNFTYTVSGVAPCFGESAVVTINIGAANGPQAVALTGTTISNTCPVTTVDLTSLQDSVQGNPTIVWSTDSDPSDGLSSTVSDSSAVSVAGTYYAYQMDDACVSPASAAVTVTINVCAQSDADGDGNPDTTDPDDDNDGILDIAETGDTDNDGIPDSLESNIIDTDGDMAFDFNDNNADDQGANDGTSGEQDGVLTGIWNDTDMDGIPDHLDAANGAGGGTDITACGDSDSDGLSDCEECPGGYICPDSDGDGIPNYMDTDSDNDGITDMAECPSGNCLDTDNDGITDNIEHNTQDTDGDGNADYNDSDADGDSAGTLDNLDTGNGLADADGDGIPNYLDASNGTGGGTDITACGDSDLDGLSDCQECPDGVICPDSDGDNIPDYMDDFDNSAGRLRLLCVNPLTETVKIKNFTGSVVDISGYSFCSKFSYSTALSSQTLVSGSLNLMPGAEVEIQITSFNLDDAAADLGLYSTTSGYGSTANMIDFTQWGSGGNGRESVAVTKGIWTAGTFISPNENPEFCYGDEDGVENGAINWKGNLVTTPVDAGTSVTVCGDTNFSTATPFTANDCGGNNSGTANPNGGAYTINANTGCIIYTAPASPTTNTDTVCLVICDNNGLCDTTKVVFPIDTTTDPITPPSPVEPGEMTNVCGDTIWSSASPITASDCGGNNSGTANPVGGSYTINPTTGCVDYTAPANPTGTSDTICLVICDANGVCDTQTVVIPIDTTTAPPVIMPTGPINPGEMATACIDTTWASASPITTMACGGGMSGTAMPNGGSYTVGADGCVTYTAPANPTTSTDTACVIICDANGICDTTNLVFPLNVPMGLDLNIKVILGGAYDTNTGMMHDSLRTKGLIPSNQPYNTLTDFSYLGAESVNAAILTTTGNNALVDWVMVELRDENTPETVIETRAGLLQRDGDIVDTDGASSLNFTSPDGNYYVAVRHRNHLGVMTNSAQALAASTPTSIDFTAAPTATYQLSGTTGNSNARQMLSGGVMVLWAGNYSDLNGTGDRIIYQGVNSDIDDVFIKVITDAGNSSFLPVYIVTPVYDRADGNMDGSIILQGANADQDQTFISVGIHPNNTDNLPIFIIYEQIPR